VSDSTEDQYFTTAGRRKVAEDLVLPLPPGVDQETFGAALDRFRLAIGDHWVFTERDDVLLYRDAYSPLLDEEGEILPSAAIAPASVEEVKEIVRIANELRIPLHPISTGKNLAYGGSAPNQSGVVVLDLKRMNRILEVNEEQGYCLVEPGVSYFDLYKHLKDNGIKLWIDVPDPGWGSLVGNALDKGSGYTMPQHRAHFDSHCGMEVVLANGEVMRTGTGGVPGSKTWQAFKMGMGPSVDGLFCGSNYGVVTKMGFWLMPEPEAYLEGIVDFMHFDDLIPLIDHWSYLENSRIISGYPDFQSPIFGTPGITGLAAMLGAGPQAPDEEYMTLMARDASPEEYEPYALKHKIPFWRMRFVFYGPEAVIRAQWQYVQDRYSAAVQDVAFEEGNFYKLPLSREEEEALVDAPILGVPNLKLFSLGARNSWSGQEPSRGHVWTTFLLPHDGRELIKANRILNKALRDEGIQAGFVFNTPFNNWERVMKYVVIFQISADPEENRKLREAVPKIIKLAASHGWAEYRTHTLFQDEMRESYSFGGHVLPRFHDTLKDALDPNGIFAPGRNGIWPKHVREERAHG